MEVMFWINSLIELALGEIKISNDNKLPFVPELADRFNYGYGSNLYNFFCTDSGAWWYREIVTYWVFAKALWNRKIKWRLGTFDIKYGGKADFVAAEPKLAWLCMSKIGYEELDFNWIICFKGTLSNANLT